VVRHLVLVQAFLGSNPSVPVVIHLASRSQVIEGGFVMRGSWDLIVVERARAQAMCPYIGGIGMPDLVALDFDGVICDGLREYFQTVALVYEEVWGRADLEPYRGAFYRLRPVVETGWEMPLVLRSLVLGQSESEILSRWPSLAAELVMAEALDAKDLGRRVDGMRDRRIAEDLDGWLAEHRFYPEMLGTLREIGEFVIISTKEGRFIRHLLERQGIEIADERIYGKERGRSKPDVLLELQRRFKQIWFVEDRLQTLYKVQQCAGLEDVRLFLADWGYNLAAERSAAREAGIVLLSGAIVGDGLRGWELGENR
jgi:phosphoglycolate phosphatase-like HAD superfamily hydrolase